MQNIFIDVLPPWVETGLQPAFYDLESGTVLQQTSRMYAKVRELNEAFNTFSENVTTEVNNFEDSVNATVEEYIEKFNQLHDYVHDYFDNLDVQEEINNKLDEMAEDGTLDDIIDAYLNDYVNLNTYIKPNFYLTMTFAEPDNVISAYVSPDGVNYKKLNITFPFAGRDISFLYNPNTKLFYATYTTGGSNNSIKIWTSPDFENWTEHTCSISGLSGAKTWAPDLFLDDDGTLYCFISNSYSDSETDILGRTLDGFDQYIIKCNDIENLTFNPASRIALNGTDNRNYIDGSMTKIGDTYYYVVKNEYNKLTELYESADLQFYTLVNANMLNSSYMVEGAHLENTGSRSYFFADGYTTRRCISTFFENDSLDSINTTLTSLYTLQGQKHGMSRYLTDMEVKDIISGIDGFSLTEYESYNKNYFLHSLSINPTGHKYLNMGSVPAVPEQFIIFGGASNTVWDNIKIDNPFGLDFLNITFAASVGATVKITNVNGKNLRHTLTVKNDNILNEKIITIPLLENWTQIDCVLGTYQVEGVDAFKDVDSKFTANGGLYYRNGVAMMRLRLTANENISASGWINFATLKDGNLVPPYTMFLVSPYNIGELQINGNTGIIGGRNLTVNSGDTVDIVGTWITKNAISA